MVFLFLSALNGLILAEEEGGSMQSERNDGVQRLS